jgi:hypothetical protein
MAFTAAQQIMIQGTTFISNVTGRARCETKSPAKSGGFSFIRRLSADDTAVYIGHAGQYRNKHPPSYNKS